MLGQSALKLPGSPHGGRRTGRAIAGRGDNGDTTGLSSGKFHGFGRGKSRNRSDGVNKLAPAPNTFQWMQRMTLVSYCYLNELESVGLVSPILLANYRPRKEIAIKLVY